MNIQRYLLSTTALLGLGVMTINSAQALDVDVSGFVGVRAIMGDVAESQGGQQDSFNLSTDSEVHVNARGESDNGVRYGATVEFEADTNATSNTDEAWIFFGGDFGEVRLGDEDGASDNMKVGGMSVAAGTGGIDGAHIGVKVGPSNSSDATKIRYDLDLGMVQVGASYTPNTSGGSAIGATNGASAAKNVIEAGVVLAPSLGDGIDIKASIVGGIADDSSGATDNDFETLMAGATVGFGGFKVGAGIGSEDWGGTETDWFSVGAAASLGDVNVSVTYGYNEVGNLDVDDLALSADMGIMPGVVVAGDLHFFDYDGQGGKSDGTAGVVRVKTSF